MSFYVFDDKKSGFAWICVDLHGFAFRIHPFHFYNRNLNSTLYNSTLYFTQQNFNSFLTYNTKREIETILFILNFTAINFLLPQDNNKDVLTENVQENLQVSK